MRTLGLVGSLVLSGMLMAGRAPAGPNVDGRLILHGNESLVYSAGSAGYCGQSGLGDCGLAVATLPATGGIQVIHALAAFTDSVESRLAGLTFGIEYDENAVGVEDYGTCGDFEIANGDWPDPGSGTATTWGTPRSGRMIECYWFAIYSVYATQATFALAPHPTQGGIFADAAQPANLDSVAAYGTLGFGTPGMVPCPPPESVGGGAWGAIIGQ